MGHRFLGALTRGPYRKFSGSRPPSRLRNRGLALPVLALLAALAVGLLFLLPGGLLHAQEAMTELEYAENGMDPVATFTAVDPEGRTVYWDLVDLDDPSGIVLNDAGMVDSEGTALTVADIADHGDFNISMDGVLTFKSPPSFESPNGGQLETAETPQASGSNTYNVVLVSSDDAPGATTDGMVPDTDGSNLPKMAYHKVTVEVTDADEDGSVSLSTLQPQAGILLNVAGTAADANDDAAATLKDQDASTAQINAAKWKWEQSSAMDGPWTLISGETTPAYTPAADVDGMYVRLTATYNDKHGDDKTAMATSAHPVRKAPAGGNAAPEFSVGETARKVKENSPSGTAVGKPVTAGDAGDILTYSFDTTASTSDHAMFSIDRATGQITVKGKLDAEAAAAGDRDSGSDGFQLQVTVRATDPYGDPDVETAVDTNSDEVTVTITVENVNESPKMTVGPTRDSQDENEDTDNAEGIQIPTLAYAVTDVDDVVADIEWSLMGADKDAFEIEKDDSPLSGAISSAMVMFKKSPNYEKPTDADMDNMYMVTVVATDAKKLTAMRDVVITVENVNDDGKITFSSVQPKVGIPFTATLTDEDGVIGDVKWQWYNEDPDDNDDGEINAADAAISKAKSATYTPKRADFDAAPPVTLHVWATYTDSIGSTSATNMAANAVVVNEENRAPEFKLNDKVITATTRMVAEDADALSTDDDTADVTTDNVGMPVTATDMSGTTPDTLTYTLAGRDAAMFRVRQDAPDTDENEGGQIEVAADTELDYETKKSYMVTVTATDPSLASATIDVTINVTDVNEAPEIAGEDDLTKEFRENSTSTIETFRATDPEKRPVYWSLKDDGEYPDDDFFDISTSGALSFKEGRDFEAAADGETDNTYKVIVIASDDAPNIGPDTYTDTAKTSERKFTVRVTHVSETGSITVNKRYPQVGVAVEATLMDGDAISSQISAATWQWYMGSTQIDGADNRSHTPTETGSLKVEATYTAKGDTRTESKSITVRAAPTGTNVDADPSFENTTEARSVDEGKANANVGAPIRATDDTPVDSGKLTYSVNPDTHFSIDNNGQLKTKMALDHENPPTLNLTVTATDPSDDSGTVTVTVTVNDVNEKPMFTAGPTRALPQPENISITTLVAAYTATDPETTDATELVWSLSGPDATDFNIGNQDGVTPGTLTFKEKPDYEMPAASNNLYRVTVEVSDGKLKATRPMTVMVTDVEEEGKVTLSSVQPKVAIDLTASLKDSDGDVENIEWQWARTTTGNSNTPVANCSTVAEADWAEIDGAEMATYTPDDDDDLYQCLQATASYTDRRGDGKSAMQESDNAVIVNTDNRAPEFPATETGMRSVAENTAAGMNIGDGMIADGEQQDMEPVMATDPNSDTLTYTLGGTDMASFGIVRASGQLQTKAKLDYEAKNAYMVTVTATDPNGLSDTIDVTIMVIDEDEAPEIIVGGLVVTGKGNVDYAENGMGMVATYSAAGPDAANATWSLSGADAGDLSISSAGVLTFMASPDYEMPMDANTDNTYMVMVKANDGTNDAMKTVSVRVTNEEEMGEVTLWASPTEALTMAPQVGDTITGAVMDPDGGVTGEMWQWARTMDTADMNSWMDITGATDAAYMVTAGDTGYYLRVMATYTDAAGTDMAYSMPTMMVGGTVDEPGMVTLWAGTVALTMAPQVGDTITGLVEDDDGGVTGESWQWSRTMDTADMSSWMDIQGATEAAYMVTADDTGYHLRVTATYTDAVGTDMDMAYSMPTMMVGGTVDEPGMVTLWAGTVALTMAPQVGDTITGLVEDDDGGVTGESWQWSRTMDTADMSSWMDIDGATDAAYMVTADDTGYHLRVTATYTDAVGTDMDMAYSMPTMMVTMMTTGDPLVDRYDANNSGTIDEKSEVIQAIRDYLFPSEGDDPISKDDVIRLIELFLFS